MPSSTAYIPSRNLSLLLVGPPKSGKTILALHFPKPYVLDCDDNLGGPVRFLRKYRPDVAEFTYDSVVRTEKEVIAPEQQWKRAVALVLDALRNPAYQTVIVDSLTTLDTMLQNHILFSDKPTEFAAGKAKMAIQHYGEFKRLMTAFIMRLTNSGKYIIIIAHEEVEKDAMDGSMNYRPAISGSLKDTIGALMTDIWRPYATPNAIGQPEYFVRTAPTPKHKLGTSLDLPPSFKFEWSVIAKALEA